ncbi:MAG: ribulose-phosphate 3-epimerase [Clostridia bacterium]|nr:ribulose-phosphate 3-epimerase [Clostridia bacterium]
MPQLAPSVLSADFSRLEEEVRKIEQTDITFLHIDVMDGHFVPNITFGPPVVKCIRKTSKMIFDVHLMISHPKQYAKPFAAAGADYIVFHIESDDEPAETINEIKSLGVKCGIAIKPKTPAEAVIPYLDRLDMVLVMTVEPGFGGQSIISECLDKIAVIKAAMKEKNIDIPVEIDGGVNAENIEYCAKKGADIIVAGSAVFGADDSAQAVRRLSALIAKSPCFSKPPKRA